MNENCYIKRAITGRTNELLNPLHETVSLLSVADALVVAMNPAKAEGAKGSNGLVIKFLHNQITGG